MVERWSEKNQHECKLTAVDNRRAVIPREKVPGVCCADALAPGVKENANPSKASRCNRLKGNSAWGLEAVQTCLRL